MCVRLCVCVCVCRILMRTYLCNSIAFCSYLEFLTALCGYFDTDFYLHSNVAMHYGSILTRWTAIVFPQHLTFQGSVNVWNLRPVPHTCFFWWMTFQTCTVKPCTVDPAVTAQLVTLRLIVTRTCTIHPRIGIPGVFLHIYNKYFTTSFCI